ncbi:PucR family transcriptional regulator ligand-binding domain-containing protein [Rhodococcus sp. G-MC3]|uniref:PucR family transcriptional regulator n=1 Tax=Rhodococcus sp. G-MC3 TaxID=3046209 RepID=UPI0024B907ED|nr:PucR family transcriptional regulator [Rhodococcus sp. G-MC3]MDJ0395785.1 PucR family transcriptional regulator ligand-binding domain-containing protein [Rhodococcus sp. G-MC3]
MRLHDLLGLSDLKLQQIVAPEHFDPVIRWVVTTDMLDPSRYLTGGELVLTGMMWRTQPADSFAFVSSVAKAGVAALAASEGGLVPEDLIDACREHGLPLFRVSADIAFATITESVVRRLSTARTSDLKAVLDRHQRLVATTGPGGMGPLLELVGSELGMECWVLTASGRVVAGQGDLADPVYLAREFLTARRLPHYVEKFGISLLPVDNDSTARVVDWFLAVRSDWQTWHSERLALAEQLSSIVAAERVRSDDRLSGTGILAQELVRAVCEGASASDIAQQLHIVGLPHRSRYIAIAAAVSETLLRLGEVRQLVREISADPSAAVGIIDGEVVAIVPAETDLTPSIEATVDILAAGLVGTGLSVGVSSLVAARDIRSAVEEARHARQLAARRNDDRYVVGHDELATLVLLLAGVPDDVRHMFRSRLLTPLSGYDAVHKSDLIATLSAFLDTNGSWTKCAELMHLHVNSVRYRIQRVEELTGRDLSRLEDRVEFYLALRLT